MPRPSYCCKICGMLRIFQLPLKCFEFCPLNWAQRSSWTKSKGGICSEQQYWLLMKIQREEENDSTLHCRAVSNGSAILSAPRTLLSAGVFPDPLYVHWFILSIAETPKHFQRKARNQVSRVEVTKEKTTYFCIGRKVRKKKENTVKWDLKKRKHPWSGFENRRLTAVVYSVSNIPTAQWEKQS